MPLLVGRLASLNRWLWRAGTGRLSWRTLRFLGNGRVGRFTRRIATVGWRLRSNIRFLRHATVRGGRRKHLAPLLLHPWNLVLDRMRDVVVLFQVFQEIADVQEGIAIEANIDEGRLHTGEDSCDAAFVEASN